MLKKTILVLLGLTLVAVIAVASIARDHYAQYVEQQIIAGARSVNVLLGFKGADISWTSFAADSVNATLRLPFFILLARLERFGVSVRPLSLLSLSPAAVVQAELYNGTLNGRGSYSLLGGTGSAALEISSVDLARHPQLNGLGLSRGNFNLALPVLRFGQSLERLEASLMLKNLERPQRLILPRTLGLPFDLSLPPLKNGALRLDLQAEPSELRIQKLSLSSSLGEVRLDAALRPPGRWEVSFGVDLTDSGRKELSAALFAPIPLNSLNGKAVLLAGREGLQIPRLQLSSELGTCAVSGSIPSDGRMDLSAKLHLSELGSSELSVYLMLLKQSFGGAQIPKEVRDYRITAKGRRSAPTVTVEAAS